MESETVNETARSNLGGVLLLVAGLTFAALAGAIMKLLSDKLPITQILWFRFAGFFVLLLPIVLFRFRAAVLRPTPAWLQVMRGCLLPLSTGFFVIGVRTMDYAEAVAVLYIYPFIIAMVGPWLLGEQTRLSSWLGIIGGFAGILLIIRPSPEGFANPGTIWVLGTGMLVAGQLILNRKLGRDVSPWLTSIWGAGTATILLTPIMLPAWAPMETEQLLLLLVLGALAAISQTMFAIAFARSPAAELAPFTYSEIVAGIAIGFAVFGSLPSLLSWVGIAIVILSGVLVARLGTTRT
ncbi:MAG: DMT family transporter [Pseudomonadota bacterium]